MFTDFEKYYHIHYKMFEKINLSTLEAYSKGVLPEFPFALPKTTVDAILSINNQHNQLFKNLSILSKTLNINQSVFNQFYNWQITIKNISEQLVSIATSKNRWDLIYDFEQITKEALLLNQSILDDNGVSKDKLKELKDFFKRIESKVYKIGTDANNLFWKLLALLSFIFAVISEVRNWIPKPEYATKQEVESIIKEQFKIYEKKLKEDKEFRITNRACKVMSKPRLKSLVIEKLPIDFEVTILQLNHKWIFVAYFSQVEKFHKTGWILKKYLANP